MRLVLFVFVVLKRVAVGATLGEELGQALGFFTGRAEGCSDECVDVPIPGILNSVKVRSSLEVLLVGAAE